MSKGQEDNVGPGGGKGIAAAAAAAAAASLPVLRRTQDPDDDDEEEEDSSYDDERPGSKRGRPTTKGRDRGEGDGRGRKGTRVHEPKGPPTYDDNNNNNNNKALKARTVLGDRHFYQGRQDWADVHRRERDAAIGPGTTMRQVFHECVTGRWWNNQRWGGGGGGGGVRELAKAIKADATAIAAYFATHHLTLEQLLARWEVLSLDTSNEVKLFLRYRVEGGVPTSRDVFDKASQAIMMTTNTTTGTHPRSYRMCFVLGPSGSGKTFFALEHLRNFLNDGPSIPSVAVYLNATRYEGVVDDSASAPTKLVERVTDALREHIRDVLEREWDPSHPLNMHVCLVFDQAGAGCTQRFFNDRDSVTRLHGALQSSKLARSITLVMCGTSLPPDTFASDHEAYYFRMRPWTRSDVEHIMDQFVGSRVDNLIRKEETATIAEAISNISLLEALATNARCARFVVEEVLDAAKQPSVIRQIGWHAHLRAQMPGIVKSVAVRYAADNGLLRLNENQRRRVAAWVLGGISQLRPGALAFPDFPGLERSEGMKATILLQRNGQRLGDRTGLVDGELYSVSVTAAVAIVLFDMAGFLSDLLPDWRGDEEVTALYAAKRSILEVWSKHEKAIREMQRGFVPDRDSMSHDEFLAALEAQGTSKDAEHRVCRWNLEFQLVTAMKELKVYRLPKPMQSPDLKSVRIPMVSKRSILMTGGELASFADVIAPFTFLLSKHTSSGHPERSVEVNLGVELDRCGLRMPVSSMSERMMRGLLALWDGSLARAGIRRHPSATGNEDGDPEDAEASPLARPAQGSRAYPENLFNRHKVSDEVLYAEILLDARVKGTDFVLPKLPDVVSITFVVVTDAERVHLILNENDTSLIITEASLDDDMRIDPTRFANDDERSWWASFQDALVPGTILQFVFTRMP